MPTVLIVDDHPRVRKILRDYFEESNLAECGEAVNGLDAIEKAQQLNPDSCPARLLYAGDEWHRSR
jgi:chemotaxis response regulator CheB